MFFADFLDTFGISFSRNPEAIWGEDLEWRLQKMVRETEAELFRLRSRLIDCRERIERLRTRSEARDFHTSRYSRIDSLLSSRMRSWPRRDSHLSQDRLEDFASRTKR